MGKKNCFFILPLPIEEVWDRTIGLWGGNRGRVKDQQISANNIYRMLIIKHNATAISWGETYKMKLGFNPKDSMTYVNIEVSLSWGGGLQWQKPKKLMAKWAQEMGVSTVKIVKKIDKNISEILIDLSNR